MGRGIEADLFARYAERLRPKLAVTEIPEGRGAPVEAKRREAEGFLAALAADAFAVALDLGGIALSSEAFAAAIGRWNAAHKQVCFLVGGAEGLDGGVIARADFVMSLGPMTWPHLLVRTLLAEQLFRAQSINSGHPYHRAGRP
jgi:23S rRNA (pseudouridine1915-N3)-methyltransferase